MKLWVKVIQIYLELNAVLKSFENYLKQLRIWKNMNNLYRASNSWILDILQKINDLEELFNFKNSFCDITK